MESSSTALNIRTIFDPETCTRKGLCPVSSIRNKGDPLESHSLYFEQHGNGPEKVIFITGYVYIFSASGIASLTLTSPYAV